MHNIQSKDRTQYFLPPSIDEYISDNNSIRFIDLFVENLLENNPDKFVWKGTNNTGRKSYSSSTMLKLLIYGYINKISGSRTLEKESYRNLELIWLLGDLHPDHWTICNYRRANIDQIKLVTLELRKFLKSFDYIDGSTVAMDGSKFKAYASKNVLSIKRLDKQISQIRQTLDIYLKEFEDIDNLEDILSSYNGDDNDINLNKLLLEKISELQEKLDKAESHKETMLEEGKSKLSQVDKDSNFMQDKDRIIMGYNGQITVDQKHHFIIQNDVVTDSNDLHQMKSNYQQVSDALNLESNNILADKGYFNLSSIYEIEATTNSSVFTPWQENNHKKADRMNNINFRYLTESDEYECSQGKKLKFIVEKQKRSHLYRIYRGVECDGCPIREKCTKSKKGRYLHRVKLSKSEEKWREDFYKRMQTEESKKKNNKRKTIVEHCFGTIKMMMGSNHFILRGIEKVRAEFNLYEMGYNIKRLTKIDTVQELLSKLSIYDWKIA